MVSTGQQNTTRLNKEITNAALASFEANVPNIEETQAQVQALAEAGEFKDSQAVGGYPSALGLADRMQTIMQGIVVEYGKADRVAQHLDEGKYSWTEMAPKVAVDLKDTPRSASRLIRVRELHARKIGPNGLVETSGELADRPITQKFHVLSEIAVRLFPENPLTREQAAIIAAFGGEELETILLADELIPQLLKQIAEAGDLNDFHEAGPVMLRSMLFLDMAARVEEAEETIKMLVNLARLPPDERAKEISRLREEGVVDENFPYPRTFNTIMRRAGGEGFTLVALDGSDDRTIIMATDSVVGGLMRRTGKEPIRIADRLTPDSKIQ